MNLALPLIYLIKSDAAFLKLREFGNSLKPVDEAHGWFFQIVFELIDAALTNYDQLKVAYQADNNHLLAWSCRNLLELTVFTKYVLVSEANARRFADDRLIDGCEIIKSLRTLELFLEPTNETKPLDDALARMEAQMVKEGVTANKHLNSADVAKDVGMKDGYACMNRVCSKLVHPSAWSILAVNKGENAFSQARPILFQCGVGYGCDLFDAIKKHQATYGMKPRVPD
jgi:Family of unknown function (DUF5677)